ncbi:hypothetical protein BDM02DRAFT_3131628 [Thelephora ganbajun]|uniref:Uncharacterized protein n=1 Tax=Thelephora ganbajun TaxID=370292 RepID=A0ACB6Z5M1_THEGA|nr:hypothetical protein BDM02DRAFT_3131628 [Thelephora ganbajun]
MSTETLETILPARRCRDYRMLGDVHIKEDREVGSAKPHEIPGIAVCTDGSGYDKKVGAAAVIVKNVVVKKSLLCHLGAETEHTVYKAGEMAVTLALHTLRGMKEPVRVAIGMDNQPIFLEMGNQGSEPGHRLMDKIHDM